jgi:hypothetical protein
LIDDFDAIVNLEPLHPALTIGNTVRAKLSIISFRPSTMAIVPHITCPARPNGLRALHGTIWKFLIIGFAMQKQ